MRSILLKGRGNHVARVDLLTPGALHVKHRRLEHAAEGKRLLRLLLLPASKLLDGFLQVLVEIAAELRHVGAAGTQDALPLRIMRERIEKVLQREVRVAPRRGFAIGDGQNDLECGTEQLS